MKTQVKVALCVAGVSLVVLLLRVTAPPELHCSLLPELEDRKLLQAKIRELPWPRDGMDWQAAPSVWLAERLEYLYPELVAALDDKQPEVAKAVLRILEEGPPKPALADALISIAGKPRHPLYAKAALALCRFATDSRARPVLVSALHDPVRYPDPFVRARLAEALHDRGEVLELMLPFLTSKHDDEVVSAARHLAGTGEPAAIAALERRTTSRQWRVVANAYLALAQVDPHHHALTEGQEHLLRNTGFHFKEEAQSYRWRLDSLAAFPQRELGPFVMQMLETDESADAAGILGLWKVREALPRIRELMWMRDDWRTSQIVGAYLAIDDSEEAGAEISKLARTCQSEHGCDFIVAGVLAARVPHERRLSLLRCQNPKTRCQGLEERRARDPEYQRTDEDRPACQVGTASPRDALASLADARRATASQFRNRGLELGLSVPNARRVVGLTSLDKARVLSSDASRWTRKEGLNTGCKDIAFTPGVVIGERYEILCKIGEGGFGEVYKARHLATGQWVALKKRRPTDTESEPEAERRAARFLREVCLCALLYHPNIAQLMDAGTAEDGQPFTVFAFVPGENLAEVLTKEGPLEPQEARHLMLQVLDALACAHAQGVIHRDLKPSNIMVVRTGARRNALVLDFGLGGFVKGSASAPSHQLTHSGELLGTPGYSSPEQLRGLEAEAKSDLFSWGLILLECLTGRPTFMGACAADIMFQALKPEPIRIPPPLTDHPVAAVIRRATEKEASLRDVSAETLLAELERCDLRRLRGGGRQPLHGFESALSTSEDRSAERPQASAQADRRPLTALCCQLSRSSAGPEQADGDEAGEAGTAAALLCSQIAHSYSGHWASTMGDKLLFYFGYPCAAENDTVRAARVALDIVRGMEAERERRPNARSWDSIRIGIHAGVATIPGGTGEEEEGFYLGLGATPRVASELAHLARPGSILVTAESASLLRSTFVLEPEAPSGPQPSYPGGEAFCLLQEREHRRSAFWELDRTTTFVGREPELELLSHRWGRARQGAGQCILVTGEAGIGKSRLIHEYLEPLATHQVTLLECGCSPEAQDSPLYPILELLGRLLRVHPGSETESNLQHLRQELDRYGAASEETVYLFARLFGLPITGDHPLSTLPPPKLRERTLDAIVSLVCEMAEADPLLLVIEDLHWADPTTLDLVAMLIKELPSAHMLALLSARPEFSPPFSTIGVLQIQLGALESQHAERMIRDLSEGSGLPAEVVSQIVDRSEGVPLFVEELTRTMVKPLRVQSNGEMTPNVPSATQIPTTLHSLLTTRLDQVGRAKQIAQYAAVLGREFTLDMLCALLAREPARIGADLDLLAQADLIHRKRRPREASYVFRHALIRDAAYESMTKSSQQNVHALVAQALEQRFPEQVSSRPDLVAHHHAEAGHMKKAVGYVTRAAELAVERAAYREAARQLSTALRWSNSLEDPDERLRTEVELLSQLLCAQLAIGIDRAELEMTAVRCLERADKVVDCPEVVPALWRLVLYCLHANPERAWPLAERLLAFAERLGDSGQQVALLPITAHCLLTRGRFEEARRKLDKALAMYVSEAHRQNAYTYGMDSKVHAHALLALLHSIQGEPQIAVRDAELAVAWAKEVAHPMSLGNALVFMGSVYQYQGERHRAEALALEILDVGQRHAMDFFRIFGGILHGWAIHSTEEVESGLQALRGSGALMGSSYWLAVAAETHAVRGAFDAALSRIEEARERAETTGESYHLPEILRLQALYIFERNPDDATALACATLALAAARDQHATAFELRAAETLASIVKGREGHQNAAASARTVANVGS